MRSRGWRWSRRWPRIAASACMPRSWMPSARWDAGTLRDLSYSLERLGRGPEAVAAAEAAVTVLEPLGPTIELAWAYANLARSRMMHSEYQVAIDLAVRAQALAEPLGALDVLSDALNTRGCSVAHMGGEWSSYLR